MSENASSNFFNEPNLELFIETLTGTTFELKVFSHDTILDIKKKIQRVEGIPVHHQNLLFRLQEVEDFKRLCDIGIVSGSTLKLVLSMRGGPISTRRLSSCDHHLLWKDLKELIDSTREEFGEKLNAGLKVSVLIFRDGDIINLIRVIENDDGTYNSYSDKLSSSPTKVLLRENSQLYYNRIEENNAMSMKLIGLRKKMAEVCLRRHFKKNNFVDVDVDDIISLGCIGDKSSREFDEDSDDVSDDEATESLRYVMDHLYQKFKRDATSLLKLHESQFGGDEEEEEEEEEDEEEEDDEDVDEEEYDRDDLKEALQICEDSIALKEKHRGKNSFVNILFQNPRFNSDAKPWRVQKPKSTTDISTSSTTFSKEARERTSFYLKHNETTLKNVKLKSKSEGGNIAKLLKGNVVLRNFDQKRKRSNCNHFTSTNHNRNHKYDLKSSTSSAATSSVGPSIAVAEDDSKSEDKTVISPIGVLPFTETVNMPKIPSHNSVRLAPLLLPDRVDRPKSNPETVIEDNAQEFCDICNADTAESFRANELGLLKRWQSVDCSSEEICNSSSSSRSPINFKENCDSSSDLEVVDRDYFLPSLFPSSPGAIPGQYAPKKDCVGDLFFGNRINEERISRCPLYRRYSQTGNFSVDSGVSENYSKSGDCFKNKPNNTWESPKINNFESRTSEKITNCDNILNIKPVSGGAWYNIINRVAESGDYLDNKMELSPLRIRGDGESKKIAEEIKKTLFSVKNECESNNVNKIRVNTSKLDDLPAIINKKRMRCESCNKKLNITNMYDCRCGKIFCGQHRYSEVHGCNYDYKTEGRKLLEQQNPLIVAEKLSKL